MTDNTLEPTQTQVVFASARAIMQQTLDPKFLKPKTNLPQKNITSGFFAIDNIIQGFHSGELITIAVRPGIGKTSFLISMINNIAICENHACGIFSLERPANKIIQRLMQSTTGMNLEKINNGELTDIENNHVRSVVNSINNSNIFISDKPGISTDTIAEKVKLMKKEGVEIIFIDYLELLHSNNSFDECDESDLCAVMTDLKKIAKESGLPIVLFSQLKKPIIYKNKYKYTPDYINDNCDTLIFLNRPSYYHINQIDNLPEDEAEITIAKNINIGDMQMTKLRIIESLGQFKDLN